MQQVIAGDMAEDVDECDDEDEMDPVMKVEIYNDNSIDKVKNSHNYNSQTNKAQTFICNEANMQKPHH